MTAAAFCSICGARFEDEGQFCSACGSRRASSGQVIDLSDRPESGHRAPTAGAQAGPRHDSASDTAYSLIFGVVLGGGLAWYFGESTRDYLIYGVAGTLIAGLVIRAFFALLNLERDRP
jgi:hypothetical protein